MPPGEEAPAGDVPASPGKVTVKLAADLHHRARTLASYHDEDLIDFLDRLLRPIIDRLYAQMAREIQGEGE